MLGGEHPLLRELAVGKQNPVSLGGLILGIDEADIGDLQHRLEFGPVGLAGRRQTNYCACRQFDRSHSPAM